MSNGHSDKETFKLEQEQKAAARTLDRNIPVEAGAGTGKTTTLTERYLTILRAHLDGPETLQQEATDKKSPYRLPDDIEQITDPDEARRLPERIVVTTFTERAAEGLKNSIRARIRDRLQEITDPERWVLWRAAADGIEASYINTTHGFCGRILEEYSIQHQKINPQFDVIDQSDATLLINVAVKELIEEEPSEIRTLSALFDRRKLTNVVAEILSDRTMADEWLSHMSKISDKKQYESFLVDLHPFESDPNELLKQVEPHIHALCELLQDDDVQDRYGTNPMKYVGRPLLQFGDQLTEHDIPSLSSVKQLSLCIELCDSLTTGDDKYADGNYFGNQSFRNATDETATEFQETMSTFLETLAPETRQVKASIAIDREAHEYLVALASLTEQAAHKYDDQKRQRGVLDYNDLINQTIKLLSNTDTTAAAQLRSDIRYVMVDEFQDTNTRQWKLIQALVSEVSEFNADNVFVVGDTKQSIYRFRDADVTVFDTAVTELHAANDRHGSSNIAPSLVTNFRTLPSTLDAINGLFDAIFAYGENKPYEAISGPLNPGRESISDVFPVTEYIPVPVDSELRDRYFPANHTLRALPESDPVDIEATTIASRIAELLNGETKVSADGTNADDSETGGRPVNPDNIAVLIRSRSALKDYERAFRTAEIPYSVVKGEGFFETPEIRALVSLFRAIADPSDEIALYAVLRSPVFGVTDETIAAVHDSETPLWESLRESDNEAIQAVVSDFDRWRTYAGTNAPNALPQFTTWTAFINKIYDETGYLTSVAADERGVAAVANVDKFREKLREFDSVGVPSLERVVARLKEQSSQQNEAEANVAEMGSGVSIMTIHEAKGQEFPVVVVPGLDKGFNKRGRVSDGSIEFERVSVDGDRTPLAGLKIPAIDWGSDDRGTFMRHAAAERRQAEERAEEKRILYVACTRARDHLILTGRHKSDDDHPSGIKQSNPENPWSWRDWVQPALFGTGDDAIENWNKLETDGEFTTKLPFNIDSSTKHGTVTVRTPPSKTLYNETQPTVEPTTQRSAYEYTPDWELMLSPSALTALEDGTKELQRDHETNQIRAVSKSKDEPIDDGVGTTENMSAEVFGQAVHRLCETRPPRNTWDQFIHQVAHEERSVGDSSAILSYNDANLENVKTAASRAIKFIDTTHDRLDILGTHDEFRIELELPNGELSGLIDHLIVTSDTYHVIDYKTDRKDSSESKSEFLARRAAHHKPQVIAYAAALSQADPDREVSTTLFFTDVDDKVTWGPEETEDAYKKTIETIRAAEANLNSN